MIKSRIFYFILLCFVVLINIVFRLPFVKKHVNTGTIRSELDLNYVKEFSIGIHEWCREHQRENKTYTFYADKYLSKRYAKIRIPTLNVAKEYAYVSNAFEIDNCLLKRLPSSYVMKANHLSGGIALVNGSNITCMKNPCLKRKSLQDNLDYLRAMCSSWLHYKYGSHGGELYYDNIRPKCLFEEFLGNYSDLVDFKIQTFHGKPYFVEIHGNRFIDHSVALYTPNWHRANIDRSPRYAGNLTDQQKPTFLKEILQCAKILSKGLTMIRMDFFVIGDTFVFAEFTPTPANCVGTYVPLSVEIFYGYVVRHPSVYVDPEDILKVIP